MTTHRLEAAPETTIDVFSPAAAPVLTVDPGDSLLVHSLDAHGYLSRPPEPGADAPQMFSTPRGHCLTGPIAVRGAQPGTTLAVHLEELTPDDWGWTVAGAKDTWLNRRLDLPDKPSWLLWDVDAAARTAADQHGRTVGLAPFLGVIGIPPAEPGEHSTIPPRAIGGGNIDCRQLVAGSTLYLPVTVPEALLCLGDGHAAQGHGEVCGTAIECGMSTRVRLDLVEDRPVSGIHAETPDGRITFGFDADLNEATASALSAMLDWMQRLFDVDRSEALALASPVVDLHVTQVVNDTWGVHAVLPDGAVR